MAIARGNPRQRPQKRPNEGSALGSGQRGVAPQRLLSTLDRDRGTPHDATPPTTPGIRVPYHGGSTELCLGGRMDLGETERLEIGVA